MILAAVLAAATATAGYCQPAADRPPAVVVDDWVAAWNRHDFDGLRHLLSADAKLAFGTDPDMTGQVWLETVLAPNARYMVLTDVESRKVEGDLVSEVERIPPALGTAPTWTVRYRVQRGCIIGIDMS